MKKELFRAKIFGVRIIISWSILLSLLFLWFSPLSVVFLVFLIAAHEAGHALMCCIFGVPVYKIEINITGGRCCHAGYVTDFQLSVIAWGGVLFQAVVLALSGIVFYFMIWYNISEENIFYLPVLYVLIILNTVYMIINLMPVRGSDGKQAWKIFTHLRFYDYFKNLSIKYRSSVNHKNTISKKNYLDYKKQIDEIFDSIQQNGWESLSKSDRRKLKEARGGIRLAGNIRK